MKKVILGVLAAGLLVMPFFVQGATLKKGASYYLNPGLTIDDNLYAAGSDVNIAGIVKGDLFVAGGNVFISGPVEGDLASVGGTVNVNGRVSGDIRVAGGNVIISNSMDGELIAAGGQVSVISGAIVAKNAKIFGGTVNYAGDVNGGLVIKGKEVYVNGRIKGDLSVQAREVKLGPSALVEGNFDYYSAQEAAMEQGATVRGAVSFHKTGEPKTTSNWLIFSFLTLAWFVKLLMFIVAALILSYSFRNQIKTIINEATGNFWKEAGRGFVLLIVVPVAIILSFITVVGVPLGFVAALLYAAFLIASSILTPLLFGRLSAKYVFKKENYEFNWWAIILAVLALELIGLIPVVGWIFAFFIFLATFGSFANYVSKKWKA